MRTRTRILVALIAGLVLGACAPPYQALRTGTTITATTTTTPAQSWTPTARTSRDYTSATIAETRSGGADGNSRNLITISGSTCSLWGLIGGTWVDPNPSNLWDDEHYRSGIKAEKPCGVIDQVVVRNEGDAVKPKADDIRLSRSWIDRTRDDCYQADYGTGGLAIEDTLLDQCYSAISARPSGTIDASKVQPLVISDSIVSVSDKPSCYKPSSYGCPNHAGWLKWDHNPSTGLRLALANVTFAAYTYPEIGSLALNAPTVACVDVTLDFLGPSSELGAFNADADTWRSACPDLTVHTGTAARDDLDAKVNAWHTRHPELSR